MKRILYLLLFISSVSFGQVWSFQANNYNVAGSLYGATNGTNGKDTSDAVFKALRNGSIYLKPNTPVVGYVFTALDTNGRGNWQAAAGGGWSLTGDAGTSFPTNFIGTTDAQTWGIGVNGRIKAAFSDVGGWIINTQNVTAPTGNYATVGSPDTISHLLAVYINSSEEAAIALDSTAIRFRTDGTERVTILNAGNVGVRNATPTEAFDVAGSVKIDSALIVIPTTSTDTAYTVPDNVSKVVFDFGGVMATGTITLPLNPKEGQSLDLYVKNSSEITALVLSPNAAVFATGYTVPTSLTSNNTIKLYFTDGYWLKNQ